MKRILTFLLCLTLFAGACPQKTMAAPAWPDNVVISAEGGIVIDADSGAVLYGKNIHIPYYPASITKILTALIIIENCEMDDIVTFSHNAVYNVESGSSSAGLDEGDQLTVRDCLYAMVLKSANEAANALAEHAAGSIEAFSAMMNARAVSLGCTDSHFNNPSGLNDPNHYTTAYDMALIAQAAFRNETFVEIDSTLYYDIPQTKKNPEGIRVYPGHKMMKKNTSQYYEGIIGGKTGYTSIAGNTLVTCARRNDMKLITVVLNGHQTHYTDTKTLLDFGFSNFRTMNAGDYDTTYTSIENDMTIAGLPAANLSVLRIPDDCKITLPSGADISETQSTISYDLPSSAPESAVAQISYLYNDRNVGTTYLLHDESVADPVAEVAAAAMAGADGANVTGADAAGTGAVAETEAGNVGGTGTARAGRTGANPAAASETGASGDDDSSAGGFHLNIPPIFWKILIGIVGAAAIIGGLTALKIHIEKKEEAERVARYQRRQQRLQDIGMSSADFDLLLQEKRSSSSLKTTGRHHRPKKHKSFLDSRRF